MVYRKCEICGKMFQSEGHTMGEWLNLCKSCNVRKGDQGSVLWSERKLQRLYKKIREIGKI